MDAPIYPRALTEPIPVTTEVAATVRLIQAELGLLVDGVLGPQTWAALLAVV